MTSDPHTHTHNKAPSLDQLPPEEQREHIHELAHSIHPIFSDQWYKWTPLHIREGAVEVLARILTGTQKKLTKSNTYIDRYLRNNLIDPFILDNEGLFARSKNRLSINPGYLSATAYVAGLSSFLGNGNVRNGLQELKVVGEKQQNLNLFMQYLGERTEGNLFYPTWRKKIQLNGVEILLNKQ